MGKRFIALTLSVATVMVMVGCAAKEEVIPVINADTQVVTQIDTGGNVDIQPEETLVPIDETAIDNGDETLMEFMSAYEIYEPYLDRVKKSGIDFQGFDSHKVFVNSIAGIFKNAEEKEDCYYIDMNKEIVNSTSAATATPEQVLVITPTESVSYIKYEKDLSAAKWVTSTKMNGRVVSFNIQEHRVKDGAVYYFSATMNNAIDIGVNGYMWSVYAMKATNNSVMCYMYDVEAENSDIIDVDTMKLFDHKDKVGFDGQITKHMEDLYSWVEASDTSMTLNKRVNGELFTSKYVLGSE